MLENKWELWDDVGVAVVSSSIYLICVGTIVFFMKKRKPFKLEQVLVVHNFISFAMALYMFQGICGASWNFFWDFYEAHWEKHVTAYDFFMHIYGAAFAYYEKWTYYFYISKYYEYLDTVLLALRKKPTSSNYGLHIIHHSTYVISCAGCHYSKMPMQYFYAWFNTLVHTVMYFYYFLTSLKLNDQMNKVLKFVIAKRITLLQLTQFVTCQLVASTYAINRIFYTEKGVECNGKFEHYLFGTFLATIYLVQFTLLLTTRYVPVIVNTITTSFTDKKQN